MFRKTKHGSRSCPVDKKLLLTTCLASVVCTQINMKDHMKATWLQEQVPVEREKAHTKQPLHKYVKCNLLHTNQLIMYPIKHNVYYFWRKYRFSRLRQYPTTISKIFHGSHLTSILPFCCTQNLVSFNWCVLKLHLQFHLHKNLLVIIFFSFASE